MSLGFHLFDPSLTPFHVHHSSPITDVARTHHDGLSITFPLWDALVLTLPPLYWYKYQSSLALEQQVESLVSYPILFVFPLYFLPERQSHLISSLLHST